MVDLKNNLFKNMDTSLIIVGVIISIIVEVINRWFGSNRLGSLVSVVLVSLVGAFGYMVLVQYNLWTSFVQLLTYASAFYAIVIKSIPSSVLTAQQ